MLNEIAHLNMVDADPCLAAASFLDDEFKEENVELIAWKTVKVASCTIKGSYDQMNDCYAAIIGWVNENGFKCAGPMFNIYHVSPHETQNPDEFVTEVCYPVE